MGDSQVPYNYEPDARTTLIAALSTPRFATYMAKAGQHVEYAFALYLYNARVAKAFLYPLGVVEVTVRNAVDAILVEKYGDNWHLDAGFRDKTLTQDGLATLNKAIARVGATAPRSQIVATLTFDFWSNLFRPEYAQALWRTRLNVAFPSIPKKTSRADVQSLVREINRLRNRVAHHEPVLDLNVPDLHSKIAEVVGYRCAETARWMRHHSTVAATIRTRPKRDGSAGLHLASRIDTNFLTVAEDFTLAEVLNKTTDLHPGIVCLDRSGKILGGFTLYDIGAYIAAAASADGGMIDLTAHQMAAVLGTVSSKAWSTMDALVPIADAVAELQKPAIRVLIAIDAKSGKPVGTIVRAHRRY